MCLQSFSFRYKKMQPVELVDYLSLSNSGEQKQPISIYSYIVFPKNNFLIA